MTRTPPQKPAALVTGASSGIGLELARLFAADRHDLVLVARREERLEEVAAELGERFGVTAHIVPADLADSEAPTAIAEAVEDLGVTVTHLVNNAGFGAYGAFADADRSGQRTMIEVNVTALTALTRAFLPGMIERRHGRVMNVASTAAFQPGPYMAVYYATKAYVLSLSIALAEELADSGVTVTTLCPGPTRTEFADRAGTGESRIFGEHVTMDVGEVARIGYRAMCRGERLAVTGALNRALARLAKVTPVSLAARVVKAIQAQEEPRQGTSSEG